MSRGAATWGTEGYVLPPPTLKSRMTYYVLVLPSPHYYHNSYFDWLVPPTYNIVPAPLLVSDAKKTKLAYISKFKSHENVMDRYGYISMLKLK